MPNALYRKLDALHRKHMLGAPIPGNYGFFLVPLTVEEAGEMLRRVQEVLVSFSIDPKRAARPGTEFYGFMTKLFPVSGEVRTP